MQSIGALTDYQFNGYRQVAGPEGVGTPTEPLNRQPERPGDSPDGRFQPICACIATSNCTAKQSQQLRPYRLKSCRSNRCYLRDGAGDLLRRVRWPLSWSLARSTALCSVRSASPWPSPWKAANPSLSAGAFAAFRSWAVVRGFALLLLATAAVAFSLMSELALIGGSRGDLTARREAQIEQGDARRTRLQVARKELSELAPSRARGGD